MCPCGCVQRHDGGEGPTCKLACLGGVSKSPITATQRAAYPRELEIVRSRGLTSFLILASSITPHKGEK